MTPADYNAAHSRSIKAAARNGLINFGLSWYWPVAIIIGAIVLTASFNKPTPPCVEVCEVRE